MLRHQIKLWFEEAVKLDVEHPRDLKDTLLRGHPKLEAFFDKLTAEVLKAEEICKKKGVTLQKKTIQDFTYDMTKYFMQGMEGEARRRYETEAQKALRQNEIDKHKEFDKVLAGKAEGEFAEAGIITNDKIDNQREVGFKEAHT